MVFLFFTGKLTATVLCTQALRLYHFSQVSWLAEFDLGEGRFVGFDEALDAFHLRVKYVACQAEAVRGFVIMDHIGPKTVSCDALRSVIVLHDSHR